MRKSFFIIMCLIAGALTYVGCDSDEYVWGSEDNSSIGKEVRNTEVNFVAPRDLAHVKAKANGVDFDVVPALDDEDARSWITKLPNGQKNGSVGQGNVSFVGHGSFYVYVVQFSGWYEAYSQYQFECGIATEDAAYKLFDGLGLGKTSNPPAEEWKYRQFNDKGVEVNLGDDVPFVVYVKAKADGGYFAKYSTKYARLLSTEELSDNRKLYILGMEDGTDMDYCDVVLYIVGNPELPAIGNDTDDHEWYDVEKNPSQPLKELVVSKGSVEYDVHQQEHADWKEIKTSIHLRDSVKAEIFLPIPEEYQAATDDFAIRAGVIYEHIEKKIQLGGEEYEIVFEVAHEADGVRITVDGRTEEAKKALAAARELWDDGLTFEVHSYIVGECSNEDVWQWLTDQPISVKATPTTNIKGQVTSAYF